MNASPSELVRNQSVRAQWRRRLIELGTIVALVAIIYSWGLPAPVALLGSLAVVPGLVIAIVLGELVVPSRSKNPRYRGPALVLLWTMLALVIVSVCLSVSSIFLDWPIAVRTMWFPRAGDAATASSTFDNAEDDRARVVEARRLGTTAMAASRELEDDFQRVTGLSYRQASDPSKRPLPVNEELLDDTVRAAWTRTVESLTHAENIGSLAAGVDVVDARLQSGSLSLSDRAELRHLSDSLARMNSELDGRRPDMEILRSRLRRLAPPSSSKDSP